MAGITQNVIGTQVTSTEPTVIVATVTSTADALASAAADDASRAAMLQADLLKEIDLKLGSIKLGVQIVTDEELETDA